jgi:EAL domain-containing protein (putative c-di-GMP-specific phosphodiesterase class I)
MGEIATTGSVLVVDDDPSLLAVYVRAIAAAGFEVETAHDGKSAVALLAEKRFDTIVSDISMPELDGIGVLRAVRLQDLDVPVVLVTGDASLETALEAVEHGALRYLRKPIELAELVAVVKHTVTLCKAAQLTRQAVALHGEQTHALDDRASLAVDFERALRGLWMAYQPIVEYSRRRVVAYEALLRSTDSVLPHAGAIVDAAQQLGMLASLGSAVRRHVGNTVSQSSIAQVFVNLHPLDLLDDDLYSPEAPLTRVAHKVVLEMTERTPLDHVSDVRERVASLRQLGFRIAIDDMGAGYSNLSSVAQLEPDVMKLDMGLVRGIEGSPTRQKLVGNMVGLCADMHVTVIAEGIETVAERDTLLRLGCDVMQGFLFAKPDRPFLAAHF